MKCNRAVVVLRGLASNQLVDVTSEEIDEMLAASLAIEADPEHLDLFAWLDRVVREHAHSSAADPNAARALASVLHETEERLKSDWYRIKASKEEIAAAESARIMMRRAVAILNDAITMAELRKLVEYSRALAPGARYVACEALGS